MSYMLYTGAALIFVDKGRDQEVMRRTGERISANVKGKVDEKDKTAVRIDR